MNIGTGPGPLEGFFLSSVEFCKFNFEGKSDNGTRNTRSTRTNLSNSSARIIRSSSNKRHSRKYVADRCHSVFKDHLEQPYTATTLQKAYFTSIFDKGLAASIDTCNDSDIDIIGAYRLSRYTNRICVHLEPSKNQSVMSVQ